MSKYTIRRKEKLLEWLIILKITKVSNITQDTVNKLLKLLNDKTNETKLRNIKNFKAFLNYCIENQIYSIHVYKTLKFPALKSNIRETTIQERDYKKLIENTKNNDFKLYMMSLWETGCRPNEIIPLKKSDIDFEKGIAKIYQSKTKKYKTIYLTDELLREFEKKSNECL